MIPDLPTEDDVEVLLDQCHAPELRERVRAAAALGCEVSQRVLVFFEIEDTIEDIKRMNPGTDYTYSYRVLKVGPTGRWQDVDILVQMPPPSNFLVMDIAFDSRLGSGTVVVQPQSEGKIIFDTGP
jgi:hypothetical protein